MRISLTFLALLLSACTAGTSGGTVPATTPDTRVTTTVTTSTTTTTTTTPPPPGRSPLTDRTAPLPSALFDLDAEPVPAPSPVTITIDAIDVDGAPITPVGVLDNGEMEIPPGSEVGWYRFGPAPGEDGSAVLAAHISFNGRDGVFRHLSRVDPGDLVEISFDDGTASTYEVVETAQYPKDGLPFDRVFSREGDPVLTLITCGGDFNRSIRSYSDNLVAYAVPVDR
jgi:LPXTG-site transpeptidase (sortase) family protein